VTCFGDVAAGEASRSTQNYQGPLSTRILPKKLEFSILIVLQTTPSNREHTLRDQEAGGSNPLAPTI